MILFKDIAIGEEFTIGGNYGNCQKKDYLVREYKKITKGTARCINQIGYGNLSHVNHVDRFSPNQSVREPIIKIKIEDYFNGSYKLEYDGKYVLLIGSDKADPDNDDRVLIPVIKEVRNANPDILKVDKDFIYVILNVGKEKR